VISSAASAGSHWCGTLGPLLTLGQGTSGSRVTGGSGRLWSPDACLPRPAQDKSWILTCAWLAASRSKQEHCYNITATPSLLHHHCYTITATPSLRTWCTMDPGAAHVLLATMSSGLLLQRQHTLHSGTLWSMSHAVASARVHVYARSSMNVSPKPRLHFGWMHVTIGRSTHACHVVQPHAMIGRAGDHCAKESPRIDPPHPTQLSHSTQRHTAMPSGCMRGACVRACCCCAIV
jgi:hypothetical protein